MQRQLVYFRDLGRQAYRQVWDLQEKLLLENVRRKQQAARLQQTDIPEALRTIHYLLFTEHPPVYTLGKSGQMSHVLLSDADREKRGIEFYHINRGGDITFHGPGQLVGYPILDLEKFTTDIGRYLRQLEEAVIRVMAGYGLRGERSKGETGVWLDPDIPGKERKICAIGVRCSRWVTMHGFAFNVNTDLKYFDYIIPCGIADPDKTVTSLAKELGRTVSMEEVKTKLKFHLMDIFAFEFENEMSAEESTHDKVKSFPKA